MRWSVALGVIVLGTSCTDPNRMAEDPLAMPDGGTDRGRSSDLEAPLVGPGLLAGPAEWESLRRRRGEDPLLGARYQRIKTWVDERMWAEPPPYAPDPLGRLGDLPDRVLGLVYGLALVYRVEQDRLYQQRAIRWLQAIAGFVDWNPGHFVDTAKLAHAVAIGLDWLGPALSESEQQQLWAALWNKGLQPAVSCYQPAESCGWVTVADGENAVANSGVGLAALVLAQQQPALAGGLLEQATTSLRASLVRFVPDGGWAQGPSDWHSATLHLAVLLAAIERLAGRPVELEQIPGLAETGLFPIYNTGPTGEPFNFADGLGPELGPQLNWLARRFQRPVYAGHLAGAAQGDRGALEGMLAALELIWYEAGGPSPEAAALPLERHFRGAGLATLRSGWGADALFVGFKAGDNSGRHGHLDQGSFVLDARGQRWALDLGADDERLPGYHEREAGRWDYYRVRAEGHNTLVIDPGSGPDQDPRAAAQMGQLRSFAQGKSIAADLTPLYATRAERVWRWLALLGDDQLLLHDDVVTRAPVTVHWAMHTAAVAEFPGGDGRTVVLRQGDARLEVSLVQPADAAFSVREARPRPHSPDPPGQAANDGIWKLTVELTEVTETAIEVRFRPLRD
jgi:hypothetical protein